MIPIAVVETETIHRLTRFPPGMPGSGSPAVIIAPSGLGAKGHIKDLEMFCKGAGLWGVHGQRLQGKPGVS